MPPSTPRLRAASCTLVIFAAACSSAPPAPAPSFDAHSPIATEATPWTGLQPRDAAEDFDFVVVTDRTGEHRAGIFASAMPKVNLLEPAFVLSVGDLIEGYTDDQEELSKQWDEMEGFIAQLDMPFFYLPGNHDLSNETMAHVWRERFGASYYYFVYKDVLFVGLNSELFGTVSNPRQPVPGPDSQAEQMAWLEGVLADHPDVRWTFVLVHQPLWDSPRIHPDWLQVEEWLGERKYTVFAGHYHNYTKHVRHDRSYLTLATTGGGSQMRGPLHGEFDHVALVSMRDGGPTVANLMLDGIAGEDIRTEEERAVVRWLAKAVRPQEMRFQGKRFRGGTVRFSVHNEGDAPLEIQGRIGTSRDFVPSEPEIRVEVAPGTEEAIAIDLRSSRATPFEELAPAHAMWTLRTTGPGNAPFELESHSTLLPERLFTCPAPAGSIVVDGVLGEWGGLPFSAPTPAEIDHPSTHSGPDDASFRFAVRCADDFLYLAFDVTDDSIVATPERIDREQDGLSLTIDTRNDPERSAVSSGYMAAILDGTLSKILTLTAGPEPNPAEDSVRATFLPPRPEGVQIATRRTADGYRTEISVPSSVLDTMRGERYGALRLDISLLDFDEGEQEHSTLWWRPSRFSDTAIPGSGTFERR